MSNLKDLITTGVGILGDIAAFFVFLVPSQTFKGIWQGSISTAHVPPHPYITALLSAMLLLYYGILQNNKILIVINIIGIVIEFAYLAVYVLCAHSVYVRKKSLLLIFIVDVLGFGVSFLTTWFAAAGHPRIKAVGWICLAFNIAVFAAPLSSMMEVIRTKNAQSIKLPLSVSLAVTAIIWFIYGLLKNDPVIMWPNVAGVLLSILQIGLCLKYKQGGIRGTAAPVDIEQQPARIPEDQPAQIVDEDQPAQIVAEDQDQPEIQEEDPPQQGPANPNP